MPKCALYLRVSTGEQTTDNQEQALREAAAVRGWEIVKVYRDHGISGAKGRDKRPGLDAMLKDAVRGKFTIMAAWSVDRLGRSVAHLIDTLGELHQAGVDLFLLQQSLDTTTPAGRAMFQMMGVFAEFERSMISERVKAGQERVRTEEARGPRYGADGLMKRPIGGQLIAKDKAAEIRQRLADGEGLRSISRQVGCGMNVIYRIRDLAAQEMTA